MVLSSINDRRRLRLIAYLLASMMIAGHVYFRLGRLRPQEVLERHHPLSRYQKTPLSEKQIRVLFFGGETSNGQGLEPVRRAYPHLVSSAVRHVTSKDLTLAAACTQSILGDENAYDYIMVEVDKNTNLSTVETLLRRLRHHFPGADIVVLHLWHPSEIRYKNSAGSFSTIHDFRRARDLLLSDEVLYEIIKSQTDVSSWSIEPRKDFRRLAFAFKARLYELSRPPDDIFSFPVAFHQYMSFFEPDGDGLSAQLHERIADSVRSTLPSRESVLQRPQRNLVRPWGDSGDQCDLWYGHGDSRTDVLPSSFLRRQPVVEFGHLHGLHKHAIELNEEGGTIKVQNPFTTDRMLFLTYMTSGDDFVDRIYPSTRVLLDGLPLLRIDPYHENADPRHLPRTSAVGLIPPGESIIQLMPMHKARLPFRLVGYSLVAPEVDPLSLDFGLENDPTPALTS